MKRKRNPFITTVEPYGGWNDYNATASQLRVAGNPRPRRRRRRSNPLVQFKAPTLRQGGQLLAGSALGYGAGVAAGAINFAFVTATNPETAEQVKYRASVGGAVLSLLELGGVSALRHKGVVSERTAGAAGGVIGYQMWQILAAQFIGYKEALQPFPGALDQVLPFDGDEAQTATRSAAERAFDPFGIL